MIIKKAKWLIKNGAKLNMRDGSGRPPLYYAGTMNLKNAAKLLLEKGAKTNIKSSKGETLLFRLEDTDLARLYINKGADVNAQNEDGLTALHYAVFSNNIEMTRMLIEEGADVNLRDYDSRLTPLDWIIIEIGVYSSELIKLLIKNGADIDYALAEKYGVVKTLKELEQDAR
jgi:ankyrin repeat protein